MRADRALAAVAAATVASPVVSRVADHLATQPSLCPSQIFLGVACPSCGGTRAGLHLLAGEPLQALASNPGVTAFLAVIGVLTMLGKVPWAEYLGVANPFGAVADSRR